MSAQREEWQMAADSSSERILRQISSIKMFSNFGKGSENIVILTL